MTLIVTACAAYGLGGRRKNNVPAHERGEEVSCTVIAAGHVYKRSSLYIRVRLSAQTDNSVPRSLPLRRTWSSFRRYTTETDDPPRLRLWLKVLMLKAEEIETLLYGCTT